MDRRELDAKLRQIFLEEWRVDGFGDQHIADAMRRAYELGLRDTCGVEARVTGHDSGVTDRRDGH